MSGKIPCFAALVLLISVVGTRAQETRPASSTFDDATFVKMAAIDGMHEVQLGKIGMAKGMRDAVKEFATMMVKDHGKANAELKVAAEAAGIAVPTAIDTEHQKHINMFQNYKGTDFDRDYMKHMVTDHVKATALFTQASKEAKNKALKDFAAKTLPVLQAHLEQAKKLSQ